MALYFGVTNWVGGIYGTHSIQGSRAAHCIAAAWSVMMLHGYEGYSQMAKTVYEATDYIVDEVRKMSEYVRIVGNPKLGNVTIASNSKKINLYKVGTILEGKGWFLGSGLGMPTLCCTIHLKNAGNMPSLIQDLKDAINEYLEIGVKEESGVFKMYGEMRGVPGFITERCVTECLDAAFDVNALKSDYKAKV